MSNTAELAVLDGSECALLVAALFALADWPFIKEEPRKLITEPQREAAQTLSESVSARWRQLLQEKGLWHSPSGRWTPELIARRAAIPRALELSLAELPLSVLALRVVELEFADDWDEFCTVTPGAIEWYPLDPQAAAKLRRKLEAKLEQK